MDRFTGPGAQQGHTNIERKQVSLAYASFPLKPQLKDVSFSSYLPPEQVAPQQVTEEAEISIFDAERYFNEGQDKRESKKQANATSNVDRNVDKCDISTIPRFSSVSSVDGYGRNYRTASFNATPTASSEASWNSQSGLLSNPPGSIAVSMRNLRLDGKKKMNKGPSAGKWFFRRRCPCSGKKSVQVEEKCAEPKMHIPSHSNASVSSNMKQSCETEQVCVNKAPNEIAKEFEKKSLRISEDRIKVVKVVTVDAKGEEQVLDSDSAADRYLTDNHFPSEIGHHRVVPSGRSFGDGGGFSFPILNPPPPPCTAKLLSSIGKQASNSNLEDPPRESLEVFQPLDDSSLQGKAIERRGLMSDNNHRSFNFPTSPNIRITTHTNDCDDGDGDAMSDASSDLFEIESFSTQSTMYPMYRRKDSLDDFSSYDGRRFGRRSLDETTTATPSIAPTECYEPSEASIDWSVTTAEGFSVANFSISASEFQYIQADQSKKLVAAGNGSKRRGSGGLLMSCRCEKAVNVGPHPVRSMTPEQHSHRPVESGRVQAAPRLSSMQIPITRSHSERMSRALTTH